MRTAWLRAGFECTIKMNSSSFSASAIGEGRVTLRDPCEGGLEPGMRSVAKSLIFLPDDPRSYEAIYAAAVTRHQAPAVWCVFFCMKH